MHSIAEIGSNVPAFLAKLWRLVEDPSTDDFIRWNPGGQSFSICNQACFARELLPLYYKHNNMASFVRQLNMYGFHKVLTLESGGLKVEKDEMEFAHPYFLQGHLYLLENIKRKIPNSKQDEAKIQPGELSRVLIDVKQMKGKQETLDSKFSSMKRENEALWREVATLRQKHMKQQQIVNKLIQFLISMVQPNRGLSLKRRFSQRMLNDICHSQNKTPHLSRSLSMSENDVPGGQNNSPSSGPVIHDVTDLLEYNTDLLRTEDGNDILEDVSTSLDRDINSSILNSDLPPSSETQPSVTCPVIQDETENVTNSNIETFPFVETPFSPVEMLVPVDPSQVMFEGANENSSEEAESEVPSNSETAQTSVLEAGASSQTKVPVVLQVPSTSSTQQPGNSANMEVAIADPLKREDLDSNLDTMQLELENLWDVLGNQGYSIDASTLLGLFSTDDVMSTQVSDVDSSSINKIDNEDVISGNEVMAYNPSLFELTENDAHFFDDKSSNPSLVTDLATESVPLLEAVEGTSKDDISSVTAPGGSLKLDISERTLDDDSDLNTPQIDLEHIGIRPRKCRKKH